MIFADLPDGADVFLDANTFVYYFTPDPVLGVPCKDLLVRLQRNEIRAYTSTHVLSEVSHRLMAAEAIKTYHWPIAGIAKRLRRHPLKVQRLRLFQKAIQEIPTLGVLVLTIPADFIDEAAAVSQATGLLSNDALIVAMMRKHGITHLASHDADFDRVPGITRYAPV